MIGKVRTTDQLGRQAVFALTAALIALGSVLAMPPRATSADSYPSACPELTDSITRLYYAYLQRPPSANEFHIWTDRYQRGETTLADISSSILRSNDFLQAHGSLSDQQFVQVTYQNLRNQRPSGDDLTHWTTVIERGYPRALMVLSMSETEEFTLATNTVPPLAGYHQWYPAGTHWYCGTGTDEQHSVIQLGPGTFYVDLLFRHTPEEAESATTSDAAAFSLQVPTRRPVLLGQGVLSGSSYDFRWDQRVDTRSALGGFISVTADASTSWTIVFSPRSIGEKRHGWEIRP